jgi:hypothetical protein
MLSFIGGIGLLTCAGEMAQCQRSAIHGPRWGFAIAPIARTGGRSLRLAPSWDSNNDLDSVWIVIGRSHTAPVDSIRISVRAGPPQSAVGNGSLAGAYQADSLGQWAPLPRALLRPETGERNAPMPMHVLGVFSPTAVAAWARSQNPNRPTVTRVAADIWRRNTYERAELYLELSGDEPGGGPGASRKPTPVKKSRK